MDEKSNKNLKKKKAEQNLHKIYVQGDNKIHILQLCS